MTDEFQPGINYKGKLIEHFDKLNLKSPYFLVKEIDKKFQCTLTLPLKDGSVNFVSDIMNTKKISEHQASFLMLQFIHNKMISGRDLNSNSSEITEPHKDEEVKSNNRTQINYKGRLIEACQSLKLQPPEFHIINIPKSLGFQCSVKLFNVPIYHINDNNNNDNDNNNNTTTDDDDDDDNSNTSSSKIIKQISLLIPESATVKDITVTGDPFLRKKDAEKHACFLALRELSEAVPIFDPISNVYISKSWIDMEEMTNKKVNTTEIPKTIGYPSSDTIDEKVSPKRKLDDVIDTDA